jgi:hypothetical protein
MPWIPAPIIGVLYAWMISQSANKSGSFSYTPLALQIGLNYHLAATAVNTTFGALPVSKGSAAGIQAGFEASFELAQQWATTNIQPTDNTVKDWNSEMPDSVWIPAATSIVNYWKGGSMATAPPPPGGGVGATNPILFAGTPAPLNSAIGAAFKLGTTVGLCNALNIAFIAHLKMVSGLWTGLAAAGTPPPPLVVPWVSLF